MIKKHDVVKYPYKFKETDVPLNECEINRIKRLLKAKFDCYDETTLLYGVKMNVNLF